VMQVYAQMQACTVPRTGATMIDHGRQSNNLACRGPLSQGSGATATGPVSETPAVCSSGTAVLIGRTFLGVMAVLRQRSSFQPFLQNVLRRRRHDRRCRLVSSVPYSQTPVRRRTRVQQSGSMYLSYSSSRPLTDTSRPEAVGEIPPFTLWLPQRQVSSLDRPRWQGWSQA
jgi:hypothetical protein